MKPTKETKSMPARGRFLKAFLPTLGLALAFGAIVSPRSRGQAVPESFSATVDEVRDAERIRAARSTLDVQASALVQRAASRLNRDPRSLSYNFDATAWTVAPRPVASSTAPVTTENSDGARAPERTLR